MASANPAPPPGAGLDHIASTPKAVLGCVAFTIFWLMAVFPSVRFLPIGRTAGALMSAALMVAFKVLTPSEAFAAVNLPTLGLLFGTMIVSTFLERAGAFEYLGWMLAWRSLGGADLLCRLCVFSALSAALLTNDTTCVILTSFILGLCRARGLPPQPYLIGLATSANIGSALTPIGNPQNLIISINGRVSFGKFLAGLIGPVAVTIVVNTLGLLVIYARRLSKERLGGRLEGEAGKSEGLEKARSEAGGQEIVEGLGLETGLGAGSREENEPHPSNSLELASIEKESPGHLADKKERETVSGIWETDSKPGVVQHPTAEHLRNGSPLVPRRSLSLGAKRRRREEWSDDADHQILGLHTNGTGSSAPEHEQNGTGGRSLTSQSSGIVIDIDRDPDGSPSGPNHYRPRSNDPSDRYYSRSDTPLERSDDLTIPGAQSDGLRTRPNSRAHQQVLVPFPDLEHREGVPAVAPTWRGRLKRLREKRPAWLFKASVYVVVAGMLAALLAGLDLPWVAMGAAVILICLDFRDAEETLDQVSYSLLVFFSGMFIAVEGFNRTGVPGQIWAWLEPHARLDTAPGSILLAAVVTLLSNVASNVPTVLLLGPRVAASAASTAGISETYAWLFLAFTSTVAGNLTMVGSAANLIVSEEAFRAKDGMQYKLSFWNHLRYGLPSTIVVLAVGIPLING